MKHLLFFCLISGMLMMTAGCEKPAPPESSLASKIKRFVPTTITADTASLSQGDRAALAKLIQVTKIFDELYLRQSWSGDLELLRKLQADTSPDGKEMLHYFNINMGPWSILDHDSAFVPGVPPRPAGANYYPQDMTKEEFTAWVAKLPDAERRRATGFFTTIRRDAAGSLTIVPYSQEYADPLASAADLLRNAAALTDNASLRDFLLKRADAFLTNDYYESDVAWMKLDSPIEPTIGPYEVYMDKLFNYKAAFEAFIALRDNEETARLERFASKLQEVENDLPIEPRYRNPKLGALAPIRVVDEVAIGGEARAGIQTAAFNLPNDERITSEMGSKRIMLKNVQEAKFRQILTPIARLAIDPAQQSLVAFQPFFTHILAHELMHGLGPHSIIVQGRKTTARQEMKELSSAFEEAKADISGLFALQYFIDHGIVDSTMERQMYVTYLAGAFRSLRFGIGDAHGKGMALQFNYLTDAGALERNEATGTYKVNFDRIKEGVRKLTGEIMTAQAEGNYGKAKEMLDRLGVIRPDVQRLLDRMTTIPVDIEPQFPLTQ
jgi:hypothetical protein